MFQALTTTELIHLLKADALQQASEEQAEDSKEEKDNITLSKNE